MSRRIALTTCILAIALSLGSCKGEMGEMLDTYCSSNRLVAPANGSLGVPTNTLLWIGDDEARRPSLAKADGTFVPIKELSKIEAGDPVFVGRPSKELEPGASYQLKTGDKVISTFTVGSGPDLEKPSVPSIAEEKPFEREQLGPRYPACSGTTYRLAGEGILFAVDREATSTLEPDKPAGTVTALTCEGCFGAQGPVDFVLSSCNTCPYEAWWPPESDKTTFRLGAFDLAGNFSGWSEPHTATR